jgi:hypothetical protein
MLQRVDLVGLSKDAVAGLRGEIAHYQAAVDPSTVYRTVAAGLAMQLGTDAADLVGRRFSCWVTPAQYGVFRSDYRLVEGEPVHRLFVLPLSAPRGSNPRFDLGEGRLFGGCLRDPRFVRR